MINRLKRLRKQYKQLVQNEHKINGSLKKIYKAKKLIKEIEDKLK
jgi:hypothetical protein